MKLDARRVEAFLRDPGATRMVLLHGEDSGLIRERAETLVRAVAGALDDPFRVSELDPADLSRLPEEAASQSLMGGRRVVRVREAGEAAAKPAEAALAGPGTALVVLEAGSLTARSALKKLVEAAQDAAAIACYPEEGRALEETIRAGLREADVRIEEEALHWVAGQLGADRASTRQEVAKMALYAGTGGVVDLEMARASVGDLAGLSLDDALFAATAGQVAMADRALEQAMAEGASPVGVLRTALSHLDRLHRVALSVAEGTPAAEAARSARPPVFFRRVPAFTRALSLWSPTALRAAMLGLNEAERACKRTGAPDDTICRNAVLTIARRAAAAARPRG
ncbi:MAG: DNA polymerase III subunit delta [Rhodospirillales bacterium]|nr:DNA polymerase III subunit delta [Rhodospirillales bacterium]